MNRAREKALPGQRRGKEGDSVTELKAWGEGKRDEVGREARPCRDCLPVVRASEAFAILEEKM